VRVLLHLSCPSVSSRSYVLGFSFTITFSVLQSRRLLFSGAFYLHARAEGRPVTITPRSITATGSHCKSTSDFLRDLLFTSYIFPYMFLRYCTGHTRVPATATDGENWRLIHRTIMSGGISVKVDYRRKWSYRARARRRPCWGSKSTSSRLLRCSETGRSGRGIDVQ
jgi:hypothetical protein